MHVVERTRKLLLKYDILQESYVQRGGRVSAPTRAVPLERILHWLEVSYTADIKECNKSIGRCVGTSYAFAYV